MRDVNRSARDSRAHEGGRARESRALRASCLLSLVLATIASPSCACPHAQKGDSNLCKICAPEDRRTTGQPISVTNHAGRVVSGEFGGVTNNTFVVSGKAYPLSILPKSEQTRVKKLAGCDVRTAKEKRLDRARQMRLERIRLREEEGEIDKETADRLRSELGGRKP